MFTIRGFNVNCMILILNVRGIALCPLYILMSVHLLSVSALLPLCNLSFFLSILFEFCKHIDIGKSGLGLEIGKFFQITTDYGL